LTPHGAVILPLPLLGSVLMKDLRPHYSLCSPSAEREAPLIDIDVRLILQFAIFVTMAIVLYALVFNPNLNVRDIARC